MPEKKEIDEVARLVRSRGQIELEELASALGKTEKQTEKLAHILEDTGKIRIDYRVTGIYLVWVGEEFSKEKPPFDESEREEEEKEEIEIPPHKIPRVPKGAPKININDKKKDQFVHKDKWSICAERKSEARAETSARKVDEARFGDTVDLGVSISTEVDEIIRRVREAGRIKMGELARAMKTDEASLEKWVYFLEEQGVLEIESSFRERYLVWKGVPEEKKYERILFNTGFSRTEQAQTSAREEGAELRELRRINSELAEKLRGVIDELDELRRVNSELETKMKTSAREVGAKTREIGKVETKIESMWEKYVPLEKEFENEVAALSAALSEKERKLGELKARVSAIPKEIEKVEKELLKVRTLEESEVEELADAKVRVWNLSSKLRALEEKLRDAGVKEELIGDLVEAENALGRLESIDKVLEKQESAERARVGEITKLLKSVESGLRAVRKGVGGRVADALSTKVERVGEKHMREAEKIKLDKEGALREIKEAIRRKEGAGEKAKEWDGT